MKTLSAVLITALWTAALSSCILTDSSSSSSSASSEIADGYAVIKGQIELPAGADTALKNTATVYVIGQHNLKVVTDSSGNFSLPVDLKLKLDNSLKSRADTNTNEMEYQLIIQTSDKQLGRKADRIRLKPRQESNIGASPLLTTGSISGRVNLQNQVEHTGTMVYIPGTSFLALTDEFGNFSLTGVPEGLYNKVRAEHDGYNYAVLSLVPVYTTTNTRVKTLLLLPSTGAAGTILINGDDPIATYLKVELIVSATSNALLMMIDDNMFFTNASWQALQSRIDYTFKTPGTNSIYIKFSDFNGLESSFRSDSIFINLIPLVTPQSPIGTINTLNPVFEWSDTDLTNNRYTYSNLVAYRLQIASDIDYSQLIRDVIVTNSQHTLAIDSLTNGQTYNWRVAIVDGNGTRWDWTTSRQFTIDTSASSSSSTSISMSSYPASSASSVSSIIVSSAASSSSSGTIGLAGEWLFSGNANDNTGNGNNGTLSGGALLTNDRFGNPGNAYYFDGVDDKVIIPNSSDFDLDHFTVSVWCRKVGTNIGFILVKGDETINNVSFRIFDNSVNYAGDAWTSISGRVFTYFEHSADTWQHITLTYDGTNQSLYINSLLRASKSQSGALITSTGDITIGTRLYDGSLMNYFRGMIDDVRIYDRALSQVEITSQFTQGGWSAPGTKWAAKTLPSSANWISVAYGNGVFVAIADGTSSTTAAYSLDSGESWIASTLPAANWSSVTYGNNKFLAVSSDNNGISATSPDGSNWTQQSISASDWRSVSYGNNTWVAVGTGVKGYSTNNGSNWTASMPASGWNWSSVTYGNSGFTAVNGETPSGSTVSMTSLDGITWSFRTMPVAAYWSGVAYGNGVYTAVSSSAGAYTTNGGTSWYTSALPAGSWSSVTYGNGVFTAIQNGGATAAVSPDGVNWTTATLPNGFYRSIAFGNGTFIALNRGISTSTTAAVSKQY